MRPHQVLGISRTASVADVKRAYARLLKLHRPDTDPEGFQRVHEAFEACLAHARRREAQALPAMALAEDGEDEGGQPDEDASGAGGSAESPDAPSAVHAPSAVDAVTPLLEELFERARRDTPQALEAWLQSDERLYSLASRRSFSEATLAALPYHEDLPWQALDVIFRCFEIDSVADPRLQRDYSARELWLRVGADERFHRQLARMREDRYGEYFSRLVLAEMFEPPNRWRRAQMLFLPSLATQLRTRFDTLSALDANRARAAVQPAVLDFWLPLTEPTRLDWRRLALGWVSIALVSALPIGLLCLAAGKDLVRFLQFWLYFTAGAGALWSLWTAGVTGRLAYFEWHQRRYGGEAPAGSSVLADPSAVIAGTFVLAGLLVLLATRVFGVPEGIEWVVFWLNGFAALVLVQGPKGYRADAILFLVSAAALVLVLAAGPSPRPAFDLHALPLAVASALLSLIAVDTLHARLRGLPTNDVRLGREWVLLVGAAVLAGIGRLWWVYG